MVIIRNEPKKHKVRYEKIKDYKNYSVYQAYSINGKPIYKECFNKFTIHSEKINRKVKEVIE